MLTNDKGLTTNTNKGYFKFEKLRVWQDAREFVSFVYKITSTFPKEERFGLIDQIRRAAVSIALNIAEGCTKGSDKDFRRYLKIAQGSVNEVITGFYLALDLHFVNEKDFTIVYDYSQKVNAKLNAFSKALSVSR